MATRFSLVIPSGIAIVVGILLMETEWLTLSPVERK